ncbi:MAG: NUDIX domain-containing protein [Verrucomicrobiaceae bacterium]|nr:NUDIX domain-containing protein [Verrucomicrobiaceae bacterium]
MIHRPAVAAILQDRSGRILICERSDIPGAWQFPQGGIETGEAPAAALAREVLEEIALPRSAYSIVAVRGPYRYRFPSGITKKGFHGASHHYFLLRLRGSKNLINASAGNGEFRQTRWIRPEEFDLAWLPRMKRSAYRRVFRNFFAVSLRFKANSG